MENYLTTDAELTAVADAIRAKGGTSEALSYPAGFVSAVAGLTGRLQVLHGRFPITSSTAKTVQIPLPALPADRQWSIVWCGCVLEDYNNYYPTDKSNLIGVVNCFTAGNELFCGYNNAKMSAYTSVNSAGRSGYYNTGTVISVTGSGSQRILTVGYESTSRTLYWPEGAVLEWHLVMGCPQD